MWAHIAVGLLCLALQASATHGPKQRVCVIGAGATGLASAKQFAQHPYEFEIAMYERDSEIGGVWLYNENTTFDQQHNLPLHSSMYKYLRTNLPKELMAFPDYREFNGEDRSAVKHETVLSYLKNYTDHFNLRRYIKFNTTVDKVTPIPGPGDWRTTKWRLHSRNLNANQTAETTSCDAVVVCNGHYFKPRVPKIPGIETFPGRVLHSHVYRMPEYFANETVLLLGAATSGVDIGIEIAKYAQAVYLSHRKPNIPGLDLKNLHQVAGVVSIEGRTFILSDGSKIEDVDSFVYCTGYEYAYPFLDENSGIAVEDNRVAPVYKHLVNVQHPSMALVGLPTLVIPFPLASIQAHYYVELLRGKVEPLPPQSVMLAQAYQLKPDQLQRYAHLLGDAQWQYCDELARLGHFESLPVLYKRGFNLWMDYHAKHILTYKRTNLRFDEENNPRLEHPENNSI